MSRKHFGFRWWGRTGTPSSRRYRHRLRPRLLELEERRLLSTLTIVVNNPTDTPVKNEVNLHQAIDQANVATEDSVITFDSNVFGNTQQTIMLRGSSTADEGLLLKNTKYSETIQGPMIQVKVSGSFALNDRVNHVFYIYSGVKASISNLIITGGYNLSLFTGGAGINNQGDLSLTDCLITGNLTGADLGLGHAKGGGLANYGTASLTDCEVDHNYAIDGGGISNDGTLTVTGGGIDRNLAQIPGISGPDYRGGGLSNYGTATLVNCSVTGNTSRDTGGGLYSSKSSSLTLTGCTVSSNTAGGDGGGLYTAGPQTHLSDCTIGGNKAHEGGGMYNNGDAWLTNCNFSKDTATYGGGLYNNAYANLNNCTASDDTANDYGGGIANYSQVVLTNNCTVNSNTANYGGGLYNDGVATLNNCIVNGNTASTAGGGLYNKNQASLQDCTVSGDQTGKNGGGLYNDGTLKLTDCTISNDSTPNDSTEGYGGGLYNIDNATAIGCTFIGDTAIRGGGVYTSDSATLTNCTFYNDTAASGGGLENTYNATLINCTLSGNEALGHGGGLANDSGATLTLGNTIVAGNTADNGDPDIDGFINTLGNNLILDSTGSNNDWLGSDIIGFNPLLASLSNYGGPTQTMAFLPGSPALDTGSNALIPSGITTDQRGYPRIVGGTVDIGAFGIERLLRRDL